MKYYFVLLLTLYAGAATAQVNHFPTSGNVGIGTNTELYQRLNIFTTDTTVPNMIRMAHLGFSNTTIYLGSVTNTYPVINQRGANLLESYRNLRIGAANASNIYFETGRTDIMAPVRMIINNIGNVGIGTETPAARLHVNGTTGAHIATYTYSNIAPSEGYMHIMNGTSLAGQYSPVILGRSYSPGRGLGLGMVGEANDVLPANELNTAAIILQGRNKSAGPLTVNNVFTVRNYNTSLLTIAANGNVGIGTVTPGPYKLAVEGTIGARKVKVTQATPWADFVFEEDYQLPSLSEVSSYIRRHKHLPGIPTAAEVEKDGVDLGEMNSKLLQKVEELTLYLIQMKEENEAMKTRLKALEDK